MGQVRHTSATTTHAVRAAIQRSQATNAALNQELGINVKTFAKWRKREALEDRKTGPAESSSTVQSADGRGCGCPYLIRKRIRIADIGEAVAKTSVVRAL